MGAMTVHHDERDRFHITVRGHSLQVDQPVEDGGTDLAPTPVELFVASLASCVAHYAHRYLLRHHLPTDGLTVTADFTMTSGPARVGEIRLDIDLPPGVPAERRAALLAVASHCTVHNSLIEVPHVQIALTDRAVAA